MPHSMPKAVKCELYAMQTRAEHLGHCSRVFPEIAEVGLLIQCVSKLLFKYNECLNIFSITINNLIWH